MRAAIQTLTLETSDRWITPQGHCQTATKMSLRALSRMVRLHLTAQHSTHQAQQLSWSRSSGISSSSSTGSSTRKTAEQLTDEELKAALPSMLFTTSNLIWSSKYAGALTAVHHSMLGATCSHPSAGVCACKHLSGACLATALFICRWIITKILPDSKALPPAGLPTSPAVRPLLLPTATLAVGVAAAGLLCMFQVGSWITGAAQSLKHLEQPAPAAPAPPKSLAEMIAERKVKRWSGSWVYAAVV